MRSFAATFHTELSALLTERALKSVGISARLAPVPRRLSSSCGFAVLYTANAPRGDLMDADAQAIYEETDGGGYSVVWEQREPL